mgnify:CR=1 FL=1
MGLHQMTTLESRLATEVANAKSLLGHLQNGISIFGGARVTKESPDFATAREIARLLALNGYSVIVGGGPGIMEAANQGAFEAANLDLKVRSVGLNIVLPFEEKGNEYQHISVNFEHFASRKVSFLRHSKKGFVVCPGGFGTLDEVFEVLCLQGTRKIDPTPVVFVNKTYWKGLLDWMSDSMLSRGLISEKELALFTVVDTPQEVLDIFSHN